MTPPENDWSQFIPPGPATELTNRDDADVVELAGHWKHGYIPLDATAVSEKMHGNTGGKKWWDGGSGGGKKTPRKVLTTKELGPFHRYKPFERPLKPSMARKTDKELNDIASRGKPNRRQLDAVHEQKVRTNAAKLSQQASDRFDIRDRARLQELGQKKKTSGLNPQDRAEHARLQTVFHPDKTAAQAKTSAAAAGGNAKNAARGQAAAAAVIKRGRMAAVGRKGQLDSKTKNKIPLNPAERAELAALNSYLGKA